MDRKCKTCKFYVEKTPSDDTKNHMVVGRCRRSAPLAGEGFPMTDPKGWCGQYRVDEDKV